LIQIGKGSRVAESTTTGKGEEAVGKVVGAIRDMIIGGELLPGQQIRQENMALRLGLSRLPVREALRQLVADGLLVHERYVGYAVARLSRDDFDQVYLMRRLLETEVIRSIDVPDITLCDELDELNGRIAAAGSEMDVALARALNKDFHFAIFRLSPLGLLVTEIERIWDWAMPYQAVSLHESTGRRRVVDEHNAMVAALRKGRTDDLIQLMDSHREGSDVQLSMMLQAGRLSRSAPA
jgi:DNA-binding GntR family transcriptional regulator